jgi:hypothetical protein
MRRVLFAALVFDCLVVMGARAQDNAEDYAGTGEQDNPRADQVAQPGTEAPSEVPPSPPLFPPSPPVGGLARQPADEAVTGGQWVFTAEYGWVYMPYGDQYVCQSAVDEYSSYAYIYLPRTGWGWWVAPWIRGVGTYPYFGTVGPLQFGWYVVLVQNGSDWTKRRAPGRARPHPTSPPPGRANGGALAPRANVPRPHPGRATLGNGGGNRGTAPAARSPSPPRAMGRDRR